MSSITQPRSNPLGTLIIILIVGVLAVLAAIGPVLGHTKQATESAAVVVAADAAVADAGAWMASSKELKRLSDAAMANLLARIARGEWLCRKDYVSARLNLRLSLYSFANKPGVEYAVISELETGEMLWGMLGFSAVWRTGLPAGGFKEVGRAGTCPQ